MLRQITYKYDICTVRCPVQGTGTSRSGPVSQEILSLGNIVAATIFPKEIVSLPGNAVAHAQYVLYRFLVILTSKHVAE